MTLKPIADKAVDQICKTVTVNSIVKFEWSVSCGSVSDLQQNKKCRADAKYQNDQSVNC